MKNGIVINGSNLNLLGQREPKIYGDQSLEDLENYTNEKLIKFNIPIKLKWQQSNLEGEIVNYIQNIYQSDNIHFLIINPGGYTHTSVSILDALKLLSIPIIEIHLSNIHKREEFRLNLITTSASSIVITGALKESYWLAALSQLN
jgi:3-dehydroquinate dehydratase-2